ncbi:uncharacterized protein LOC106645574 isoform X2 [Copidosoma floridanum]|uniref:uncharacterized protein LOC106645574 isoform X2 n=1 Tax=Copidosoma floridanum TaxID=29053 RepID=UPI0006C9DBAB|nr:uncharacterized protein LOC106645574 isoform X2 [Copidosoma floridanum]
MIIGLFFVFAAVFAVTAVSDPTPKTTPSPTTVTTTITTTTTTDDEFSHCDCDDHCLESKVIGLKKNASGSEALGNNRLLLEDTDEDGNRTICARNRDLVDRSFPSVCHMMCYNRCTKYSSRMGLIGEKVLTFIGAYRENFFKLRNGPC